MLLRSKPLKIQKATMRYLMTLIEIKPHHWGWEVFEGCL
jgi:hypothetical protein